MAKRLARRFRLEIHLRCVICLSAVKTTFVSTTVASLALLGYQATATEPAKAKPAAKPQAPSIPIHQAAYKGDIESILQHHAAGTDIDLRNQWNATPLHYSARSGKLIGAQALVGVGADVNAKNDDGDTPLHFAASKGSAEIVTLLLTNKAKVDEPDAEGMTALHRAARGGHGAAIEVLIANGAAVNIKNKAGLTPLELADADAVEVLRKHGAQSAVKLGALSDDAANGNLEAVKQHLKAGSDVNGKDNLGRTALGYAKQYNKPRMAALLEAAAADPGAAVADPEATLAPFRAEVAALRRLVGERGLEAGLTAIISEPEVLQQREADAVDLHAAAREGRLADLAAGLRKKQIVDQLAAGAPCRPHPSFSRPLVTAPGLCVRWQRWRSGTEATSRRWTTR